LLRCEVTSAGDVAFDQKFGHGLTSKGDFDERSFEQAREAQDTLVRTIALETVEGEVWDGDGEEV
jgi:hypothetical protein